PGGAQRLLRLKARRPRPRRVLEAMEQATDIDIHAHGVVDRALSDATSSRCRRSRTATTR
ncbi:hypothetical protein, partial [Corallococcus sp. 4LFB]|uniref:hypothetical protein n=1 Tax=Corallococcus sp. 4LFB TaxID=3383249 RepID=UPI003975A4AF